MKKNSILFISFIIWFAVFSGFSASGQESASDSLRNSQLQELKNIVDHDRIIARRWWYGWIAGYSAATAVQGVVYFSTDEKTTQQDMIVGAATTFLGAVGGLLTPIVPGKSSWKNYDIQADDTSRVSYANLLKEIARREKDGRSWKMHVITGVVNIGSGLVTWLGFKRTVGDGLINFGINTVITEAQIWTQPVRAIKDYQNITGSEPGKIKSSSLKPENKLFLSGGPGGFVLRYQF